MLKVLGVGLSKTGTSSLHRAMQILGFNCIHHDQARLNDILDGSNPHPNFRRYDDVDAVTDIPSAYFYREILDAYPDCKAILTVREIESWWTSISFHFNESFPVGQRRPSYSSVFGGAHRLSDDENRFLTNLRNCVYGSTLATEFLFKKKYVDHNRRVQSDIPADRLLVMDVTAGDDWEPLCSFLGTRVPGVPFPRENKTTNRRYLPGSAVA